MRKAIVTINNGQTGIYEQIAEGTLREAVAAFNSETEAAARLGWTITHSMPGTANGVMTTTYQHDGFTSYLSLIEVEN